MNNDNVSAKLSMTLNKNHIRKWRKGQRGRLSEQEEAETRRKGVRSRFLRTSWRDPQGLLWNELWLPLHAARAESWARP